MDRIGQIACAVVAGRGDQSESIGMVGRTLGVDPRKLRLGSSHHCPVECLIDRHPNFLLCCTLALAVNLRHGF
jgi:hypothetical protein